MFGCPPTIEAKRATENNEEPPVRRRDLNRQTPRARHQAWSHGVCESLRRVSTRLKTTCILREIASAGVVVVASMMVTRSLPQTDVRSRLERLIGIGRQQRHSGLRVYLHGEQHREQHRQHRAEHKTSCRSHATSWSAPDSAARPGRGNARAGLNFEFPRNSSQLQNPNVYFFCTRATRNVVHNSARHDPI